MKSLLKFFILSSSFFIIIFFIIVSIANSQNRILINEFLIDPQPQQVELINISTESADISGWYIDDSGGKTYFTIPPNSIIYPNSCLVYGGDFNLNESSPDIIRLFDNSAPPTSSARLIDFFSYKSSSGSGITYFRLPDGENIWATGTASLGFFNSTLQPCVVTPTQTPTPTPTPSLTPTPTLTPTSVPTNTPTPQPTPSIISYDNIYLSEVMVNPPTDEKEWVEIYNHNDFLVSLQNWYIDDIENGGSSPKTFSLDVPPKSYGIFNLSSSMFNNDGDNVRLLDFNKITKDSFEYSSSEKGKTWGRISLDDDNFCLQEPSKGLVNNPCLTNSPTPTTIITITNNPSPTKLITSSITPIQTLSLSKPTVKYQANSYLNKNMMLNNGSLDEINQNDEQILGASQKIIDTYPKALIASLSFASLSFSFLTIFSFLLRMKLNI